LVVPAETGELICRHAVGPGSETVVGWRLGRGQGLASQAAQTGEMVVVPDTRLDSRHYRGVNRQIGLELRSVVSIPLKLKVKSLAC